MNSLGVGLSWAASRPVSAISTRTDTNSPPGIDLVQPVNHSLVLVGRSRSIVIPPRMFGQAPGRDFHLPVSVPRPARLWRSLMWPAPAIARIANGWPGPATDRIGACCPVGETLVFPRAAMADHRAALAWVRPRWARAPRYCAGVIVASNVRNGAKLHEHIAISTSSNYHYCVERTPFLSDALPLPARRGSTVFGEQFPTALSGHPLRGPVASPGWRAILTGVVFASVYPSPIVVGDGGRNLEHGASSSIPLKQEPAVLPVSYR